MLIGDGAGVVRIALAELIGSCSQNEGAENR